MKSTRWFSVGLLVGAVTVLVGHQLWESVLQTAASGNSSPFLFENSDPDAPSIQQWEWPTTIKASSTVAATVRSMVDQSSSADISPQQQKQQQQQHVHEAPDHVILPNTYTESDRQGSDTRYQATRDFHIQKPEIEHLLQVLQEDMGSKNPNASVFGLPAKYPRYKPPLLARMTSSLPKVERLTDRQMNILFLYADDWRHDTLGTANPLVQTPILDQMAQQGVRFTHNCVTTSVCWISRATLFTGQYMARHKTKDIAEFYVPVNETLFSLLQNSGYHTGHVGKLGIWKPNLFDSQISDFVGTEENWHVRNISGREWQITEWNEHQAMKFLDKRPRDKPFFLHVGFYATHAHVTHPEQYIPQKRSLDLYKNDTVPFPITGSDAARWKLPRFITEGNEGRNRWRMRFNQSQIMKNGENKYQYMMKNMYRMVTEVDETCGKLMAKIKQQEGTLDNTLIIFTADNGNFQAEHGLADKWYPHEESIRVPLIIRDPRMDPNVVGKTLDDFTLNIDLAPTILGAAGIQALPSMMGRDMSVLYRRENTLPVQKPSAMRSWKGNRAHWPLSKLPWRSEFFYEHPIIGNKHWIPSSEALVRKSHKYMYWPDWDFEQLFDLGKDPIEDHDVFSDPAYQHILEDMRRRFAELKAVAYSPLPVTM